MVVGGSSEILSSCSTIQAESQSSSIKQRNSIVASFPGSLMECSLGELDDDGR